MSWSLGLIGHPVSHSLSPVLHHAALAACGLEGRYVLLDTPDYKALDGRFQALRVGHFHGLNVTVPYKQAAAARCDRLEGAARVLNAANTLVARDSEIVGHNTDVAGLTAALTRAFGPDVCRGRAVAVLGAGGAARSAVAAADAMGAAEIGVANRTPSRAHALVEALAPHLNAALRVASTVIDAAGGAALCLNATSLGMGAAPGGPGWDIACRVGGDAGRALASDGVVMDLVYAPTATPFLVGATCAGHRGADGLAMLAFQAAAAFTLWTGQSDVEAPMLDALLGHRAGGV